MTMHDTRHDPDTVTETQRTMGTLSETLTTLQRSRVPDSDWKALAGIFADLHDGGWAVGEIVAELTKGGLHSSSPGVELIKRATRLLDRRPPTVERQQRRAREQARTAAEQAKREASNAEEAYTDYLQAAVDQLPAAERAALIARARAAQPTEFLRDVANSRPDDHPLVQALTRQQYAAENDIPPPTHNAVIGGEQ